MISWREWRSLGGEEMLKHPAVASIARAIAIQTDFQIWLGYETPTIVPFAPSCHIALAGLVRSIDCYGSWDMTPVTVATTVFQFDGKIGIPGMFNAFWKVGFIELGKVGSIVLRDNMNMFPCGLTQFKEARESEKKAAKITASRTKLLDGITPSTGR